MAVEVTLYFPSEAVADLVCVVVAMYGVVARYTVAFAAACVVISRVFVGDGVLSLSLSLAVEFCAIIVAVCVGNIVEVMTPVVLLEVAWTGKKILILILQECLVF